MLLISIQVLFPLILSAQSGKAVNPIIFADVPDASIIRVEDTYYMSSTTMHMSPGVPVMKSMDLVNWEIIGYAYNSLVDNAAMNLSNGQNAYGRGSWASCLRYYEGRYYLSTFAQTSGKTHVFTTDDIESGQWEEVSFAPSYHDHTLHFEDDGRIYMIWGAGEIRIVELKPDFSGIIPETEQVLISNASQPAGDNIMLQAEGSQLFKINGFYYLFNIVWPLDGMRTVLVHRSESLHGPYEGRVALADRGIAQGGLIDTPAGDWFAYLFRDFGAVGRIPYLVPVTWEDNWPVLGEDGKVPESLPLPASAGLIPNLVSSDEFERKETDGYSLPLVWQWNHNPIEESWSLTERKGYLRLRSERLDQSFLDTRNTLTQRTFGPQSQVVTKLDVSGLKQGDVAGLALLQKEFGYIGVKNNGQQKSIVMVLGKDQNEEVQAEIPLESGEVFLKASCDFENRKDQALFYYSLDGVDWEKFGQTLEMKYTLPHFMGYRYGLFFYAEKELGGYADFDFFRIDRGL
ncbi:MAG: glycoside hydrolase [Mongoliibacter sp.]|nr:MAG: glycoside hydrolase [Mongoliibacter sp.]